MLSFFRRVSSSKIGTWIMAIVVLAIMAGFALGNLSNFGSGTMGFGMSSNTLAKVGPEDVTDKDVTDAMQRHLEQVRAQQPNADYSTIMGDFETILDELIDSKTLVA